VSTSKADLPNDKNLKVVQTVTMHSLRRSRIPIAENA